MAWGDDATLIDVAEYLKPKAGKPGLPDYSGVNVVGPYPTSSLPVMSPDYVFGKKIPRPKTDAEGHIIPTLPADAPLGAGGGSMTQPRVTVYPEARQQVVDFWKSKGAPEHVAEGIADRVKVESGFNPTIANPTSGATGLYQHLGERKSKLQELPNWQDPAAQNEFAYREVTGGDKQATAAWERIMSAKTREEAARLWDQNFERSGATGKPSGGWDSAPVVSAGNWRVSPRAVQFEQGRRDTSVVYMSPADYLAMTPPLEGDTETRTKRRSLAKSLALGDDIESIPTLDVKGRDGKLEVIDQDGRNRATAAQEAGVDLIPVAVHGATGDAKEIVGMRGGEARPFDFMRVPKVAESAGRPSYLPFSSDASTGPEMASAGVAGTAPSPRVPTVPPAPQVDAMGRDALRQSQEKIFYNDAGQPFTLSGAVPQQPAAPAASPPQERLPGEIPGVGRLSEMIAGIMRGAVEGGQRAMGVGEVGQNPLRQLSPDIIGAATALGGAPLPPASRFTPGLSALRQIAPEGQNMMAGAAEARAMGFPRPVPLERLTPERAALAKSAAEDYAIPVYGRETPATQVNRQRSFNRAAARTIGEDAPALTPGVMKAAKARLQEGLERIESGYRVSFTPKFRQQLGQIWSDAQVNLNKQERAVISRNLRNILVDEAKTAAQTPAAKKLAKDVMRSGMDGKLFGNTMRHNGALDKAAGNANPNIANAAGEIKEAMRGLLQDNLPEPVRAEYQNLRYQYKNMKTLEPVVEKSPTGDVDPMRLDTQVDKNFPNRAYDKEPALVKLVDIGKEFIKRPAEEAVKEGAFGRNAIRRYAELSIGGALGHAIGGIPGAVLGAAAAMGLDRAVGAAMQPRLTQDLVMRALAKIPPPAAKRNAIAAMMSARGAQSMVLPGAPSIGPAASPFRLPTASLLAQQPQQPQPSQ